MICHHSGSGQWAGKGTTKDRRSDWGWQLVFPLPFALPWFWKPKFFQANSEMNTSSQLLWLTRDLLASLYSSAVQRTSGPMGRMLAEKVGPYLERNNLLLIKWHLLSKFFGLFLSTGWNVSRLRDVTGYGLKKGSMIFFESDGCSRGLVSCVTNQKLMVKFHSKSFSPLDRRLVIYFETQLRNKLEHHLSVDLPCVKH